MERLANQVVDDVWPVVLRRVDVVDAELDRAAQDRAGTVGIPWRSEDARAGELHGAEADPAHGMGTQPCCRAQRHATGCATFEAATIRVPTVGACLLLLRTASAAERHKQPSSPIRVPRRVRAAVRE